MSADKLAREKERIETWMSPIPDTREWEAEFENKWRLYFGDCNCNKEAFIKPFITTLLLAEREKWNKENEADFDQWIVRWVEGGAKAECARIEEAVGKLHQKRQKLEGDAWGPALIELAAVLKIIRGDI